LRILVYSMNFSPELIGIGKYSGEMARWLSLRGHEVRVVSAPPYYPDWRISKPFSGARYTTHEEDGILLSRCPIWIPRAPSGLKRVFHLLSFAISSFPQVLAQSFWRPDVVWVVEPSVLTFPAALLVGRISGSKTWAHVQDLEVDAAFDLGMLPGFLRRFALAAERWLLRQFDRVSTISPNMSSRICAKGIPESDVVLFPNWIDTRAIYPLDRPSSFRAELGITEGKIVGLYSGNMAAKQGFEVLMDAVDRLIHRSDIHFVFCGDGPSRPILAERFASNANVHMLRLQPIERLNDLLNLADIHFLPQRSDAADLVMPSKLLGMFASGRPVITTAEADTALARVVDNRGMSVKPGDAAAFASAFELLANNHELRSRLGAEARRFAVSNMSADSILPRFESDLTMVASSGLALSTTASNHE
jgi:colanic acid biosynthesis glycosyl transferase WcaI